MIEFILKYENGLKKFEKTYNFNEEEEFTNEFNNICTLFDIPENKRSNFSLQLENGNTGKYYYKSIPKSILKNKEKMIVYLKLKPEIKARDCITLIESDEKVEKPKILFKLKDLLQDPYFAEEFISLNGIAILAKELTKLRGNVQGYCLASLRSALIYVSALRIISDSPHVVGDIYRLTDTTGFQNVQIYKNALELMIVFCSYLDNGIKLVKQAAKKLAHSKGQLLFQNLMEIMKSEDLDVQVNCITLLNVMLSKSTDRQKKKLIFVWKQAGLENVLEFVNKSEFSGVREQLGIFQKISSIEIPRSWFVCERFKKELDKMTVKYEQVQEKLFAYQRQQQMVKMLKQELHRCYETINMFSIKYGFTDKLCTPHRIGSSSSTDTVDIDVTNIVDLSGFQKQEMEMTEQFEMLQKTRRELVRQFLQDPSFEDLIPKIEKKDDFDTLFGDSDDETTPPPPEENNEKDKEIENLKSEIELLQLQINMESQEKEEEIRKMKTENEKLRIEFSSFSMKYNKTTKELENKTKQIEEMIKEIEQLKTASIKVEKSNERDIIPLCNVADTSQTNIPPPPINLNIPPPLTSNSVDQESFNNSVTIPPPPTIPIHPSTNIPAPPTTISVIPSPPGNIPIPPIAIPNPPISNNIPKPPGSESNIPMPPPCNIPAPPTSNPTCIIPMPPGFSSTNIPPPPISNIPMPPGFGTNNIPNPPGFGSNIPTPPLSLVNIPPNTVPTPPSLGIPIPPGFGTNNIPNPPGFVNNIIPMPPGSGIPMPPNSGIPMPPGVVNNIPVTPGVGIPTPPGSGYGVPFPPVIQSSIPMMPSLAPTLPIKPVIQPKKSMKPLFWEKLVNSHTEESVWKHVKEGSFDSDEFESLFCKKERKPNSRDLKSKEKVEETILLDGKTYNNLAIMLKKLPRITEIEQAVLNLNMNILNLEQIELLISNLPSAETITAFNSVKNNKNVNAYEDAEKFMLTVTTLPEFGTRLRCWLYSLQFENNLRIVQIPLEILEKAITIVKDSENFKIILGFILSAGNYLNGGTKKGQADGFQLDILPKLEQTRDNTNKGSLLDYIFRRVYENHPKVIEIVSEFEPIYTAKEITFENLKKDNESIQNALKDFKAKVKAVQGKVEKEDVFIKQMSTFFKKAKENEEDIKKNLANQEVSFKKVLKFYGYKDRDIQKLEPKDLFGCLSQFLDNLKNSIEKIKKEEAQKAKTRIAPKGQGAKISSAGLGEDAMAAVVNQIKTKLKDNSKH